MRKTGNFLSLQRGIGVACIQACLVWVVIWLLTWSLPLLAQNSGDVEITASVGSDKIGLDDLLLYTITFKGINNPSEPDLSNINGFNIRQSSRSTEFRFINGVSSYYTNFIYYLSAEKTGTFSLPPVSYSYQGREYKTQAFKITVVPGSVAPHQQPQQRQMPSVFDEDDFFSSQPRQTRQPEIDIRVEPLVSKRKMYRGEQVIFSVLLYTRNRLSTINMVSDKSLTGFWQEWFPEAKSIEGQSKNINGKVYLVYEIRKASLFPTNTGKMNIPALKFEMALRDDIFSLFSNGQPIIRSTQPLAIEVQDLPPAASGLPVGRFALDVRATKTQVNINDILTVKIRISGSGNIKTITPPEFPDSEDFRVYPPKISRDISFQDSGISGYVEAEVPISFKKNGNINLPPLTFKYFDPIQESVNTLNSPAISVVVSGHKEKDTSASSIAHTEIIKTGEDIDFIKTGHISNQDNNLYQSSIFTLLLALPFLVNLLFLLKIYVFDRWVTNNMVLVGRKRLSRTLHALHQIHHRGQISPILENYLKEKTGMGLSALTIQGIDQLFEKYGVADSDAKIFLRLKNESDSVRFAPEQTSSSQRNQQDALKQDIKILAEILKRIDSKIK